MTEPAPTGPATSYPHVVSTLEVRTNRRTIDRSLGVVCLLMLAPVALGLLLGGYFLAQGAGCGALVFAVPVVGFLPLAFAQWLVWTGTRRIEHPVTVGPQGMAFETPQGGLAVPWEAVTALAITSDRRAPMLVVRLHPQVAPGAPGVSNTLVASGWRLVRRQGLRVALRAVETSPEELGRAIALASSGRFPNAPYPNASPPVVNR